MLEEPTIRLIKRQYLLDHFEFLFEEAVYYRIHKDNFENPRFTLWRLGQETEGKTIYDPSKGQDQILSAI